MVVLTDSSMINDGGVFVYVSNRYFVVYILLIVNTILVLIIVFYIEQYVSVPDGFVFLLNIEVI